MKKYKICSKCGRELPLNKDFFEKRKVSKDGFRGVCRECNGHSFKVKDFETSKKKIKKCRTCNQEYPLNEEYFSKSTRTSDRFKTVCKNCEVKVIRSTTKSMYSKDEIRSKISNVKEGYKICLCCGREFPSTKTYFQAKDSYDGLNSKCKECVGSSFEERDYEIWNEEDLNILKEKFPITSDLELSNLITNHSYNSIRSKAKKMGLSKILIKSDLWVEEEDNYLINNYGIINLNEISNKLNRTNDAIKARASKLNIKVATWWSDEELRLLRDNFSNMSTKELQIKYLPNRDIKNISMRAYKLGIHKSSDFLKEKRKSIGELVISNILDENKIIFKREYRIKEFDDSIKRRLSFDFYLPDLNICIEYQGVQHYKPIDRFGGSKGFEIQVKNDNFKREFCKKYKIRLIEIPYNIEDIEGYLLNLL